MFGLSNNSSSKFIYVPLNEVPLFMYNHGANKHLRLTTVLKARACKLLWIHKFVCKWICCHLEKDLMSEDNRIFSNCVKISTSDLTWIIWKNHVVLVYFSTHLIQYDIQVGQCWYMPDKLCCQLKVAAFVGTRSKYIYLQCVSNWSEFKLS